MKLGWIAAATAMGALVMACGGQQANGGWMTKGGWDASSRAAPASQQQAAPTAKESLPEELMSNPYASPKGPASNLTVDKSDPWEKTPSSGKAKTQKGDEPGW
jgi:hypothetical protein